MKKTLLLILSVCFLFAAVGCSSGTDYSSDIDRLNAQIEQLQSELNALKGENSDTDALKEQIEQLQEQITALQQENAALEENLKQTSEELTAKAEALQTELTAATARLTALEAVVNTEPVVCKIGDTFTLTNNGIKLFSIQFVRFDGNIIYEGKPAYDTLICEFTNFAMPYSNVYNYIGAHAVSPTTSYNQTERGDIAIKQNETQTISFWFRESGGTARPDPNELTAVYIGISTGTTGDSTVIPFVILRMNGAEV